MKRLFKLALGLLVLYIVLRFLKTYLRHWEVELDQSAGLPLSPFKSPPPTSPPSPPDQPTRLNPNLADVEALVTLPGIGPALAARIVAYREQVAPFADLNDLTKVRGIGPALLQRLRPLITLEA